MTEIKTRKRVKKFNSAEAVASHLGLEISEVKNMQYHHGHTSSPVFVIGDCYYCASKKGKDPATRYVENDGWDWVKCEPNPINRQLGWIVWKAQMNK